MIADSADGFIHVSGPPWTGDGQYRALAIDAFKMNVLCEEHNSALSELDSAAQQFFGFLQATTRHDNRQSRSFLVNGYDLERWAFKSTCGMVFGGIAQSTNGAKASPDSTPDHDLRLVFDADEWKDRSGAGLSLVSQRDTARAHPLQVRWTPIVTSDSNRVQGARLELCGFEFIVLAHREAALGYSAVRPLYNRPGGIRFVGPGDCISELHISWNDNERHHPVTLRHAGVRWDESE
jgi:hypothetical protein